MTETARRPLPAELIDDHTEDLKQEAGHVLAAMALAHESGASGRTINSLLSEQVADGSISPEDASSRADAVRSLVHTMHARAGGIQDAQDRTDQTVLGYRQGAVPQTHVDKLKSAGQERLDLIDRRIERVQDREVA